MHCYTANNTTTTEVYSSMCNPQNMGIICSVYGDYATTSSVVNSPVLHLFANPRGTEAIHNSRCVRIRANSYRTLSTTARETHTIIRGVSRRMRGRYRIT